MDLERAKLIKQNLTFSNAFIIGGLAVVFIVLFIAQLNDAAVTSMIVGYSVATLGLLLFISVLYMLQDAIPFVSKMASLIPFITLLCIFILSIVYISIHYNKISAGHVDPAYFIYSKISIVLSIIQIWYVSNILYSMLSTGSMKMNIANKTSAQLLLFSVINMISLVTAGVILNYFSTDG
jgi:hypothetical protein